MQMNVQFPATFHGFTYDRKTGRETSRKIKTADGQRYNLPLSQTLGFAKTKDWHPPLATHWATISNWLSRKTGIQDARPERER